MDSLDDIFGANNLDEGNSTIDDDFEALFSNITVPSSSDIDSICEGDGNTTTTSTVSPIQQPRPTIASSDNGHVSTASTTAADSSLHTDGSPKTAEEKVAIAAISNTNAMTPDWSLLGGTPEAEDNEDKAAPLTTTTTTTAATATSSTQSIPADDIFASWASDLQESALLPSSNAQSQNNIPDLLSGVGVGVKNDDVTMAATTTTTKTFEDSGNLLFDFLGDAVAESNVEAPDSSSADTADSVMAGAQKSSSPDLLFEQHGLEEKETGKASDSKTAPIAASATSMANGLLDIFATSQSQSSLLKEEDELSKADTGYSDSNTFIAEVTSAAATTIKSSSLFQDEDDEFDIFGTSSTPKAKTKRKQAKNADDAGTLPPLDADPSPGATDVKQGEATSSPTTLLLPDAADDERPGSCGDLLVGGLDGPGLPDIVAMETTPEPDTITAKDTAVKEAERNTQEKDTESDGWIMQSADSNDEEDMSPDVDEDGEKDEKDEKAETENTEKEEKAKIADSGGDTNERSDTKKAPPEENFMDFSILEMPGYAHLNLEVNKHKRTLSQKGSISRRKRPTRAAIHVSGMESEDSLFQDSTEPKSKASDLSAGDSETQRDDEAGKGDHAGESTPPPEKKPSPIKNLAGGIKIPGLLQGLSKAKPFAKKSKKGASEEGGGEAKGAAAKGPETMEVTQNDDANAAPKSTAPPSTIRKPPGALGRMLPVPPSSKVLKDSQNKNIVNAEASTVKPSSLAGPGKTLPPSSSSSSSAASVAAASGKLLPPLKPNLESSSSSSSPSPLPKPSASPKHTPPPPVAKKPTVPSKPPKPSSPAKNSSSSSSVVSSATTSAVKEDATSSTLPTSKKNESSSTTKAAAATTETPTPSNVKAKPPALQVAPKPRLKPIPPKPAATSSSSSSNPEKSPKLGLSSSSSPLPGIDKQSEKPESAEKTSEKKENIPLLSTNGFSSGSPFSKENKKQNNAMNGSNADKDDTFKADAMPRKASISGVCPVTPPIFGDKPAPRKNSITGSAYAPMGFRSTLGSANSGDSEGKSRTSSTSSYDESKKSYSRQSSETPSTESTENKSNKNALHENSEDTKNISLNSDIVLKETNRTVADDKKKIETPPQKSIGKDLDANDEASPFGIQLRKTTKKAPVPKPTEPKETESPVNWRQSLGQRRRSSVQKDFGMSAEPVEKAATETDKPEWMKALSERRKRLRDSGIIPADEK